MSGDAIRIYLETIAKGDGAKRVADDLAKLNREAARVAPGQRNSAAALLEASRAFEDMQYGIRGVLNNIPSLVQSLGLGAGLAGGISIAAVAATSLLPKLSEWLGLTEALDDALGGTSKRLREQADAAGAKLTAALGMATKESDAFAAQQRKEEQAIKATNDELERSAKLLDARARIQLMMEDAALASQVEDIKAQGLSPKDEAAAIAQAKLGSAQRKAATEEQARLGQMQLATGGRNQALVAYENTMAERQRLQQQKADAARYEASLTEAARLRDQLAALEQEKANSDRRGTYEPQRERERAAEMQRIQSEIARRDQTAAGLVSQYGTVPSFQAGDEARLKSVQEAEKDRAKQFQERQGALVSLTNEQRIAREISAAQLGITASQTARAGGITSAPSVLGAPAPLPGASRGPAGGLGPALGQLPVSLDELNKTFTALTQTIEQLTTTAKKTESRVKNAR